MQLKFSGQAVHTVQTKLQVHWLERIPVPTVEQCRRHGEPTTAHQVRHGNPSPENISSLPGRVIAPNLDTVNLGSLGLALQWLGI